MVTAPAKLTLSLRVSGVRDDGYHLIDAVMVSLDLADELVIGPGDDLVVEVPPGCGRHMGEDRHDPVPSTRFQTKIGEIRHDRVDRDPTLLGKPTGLLQSNRGHVDSCDGESALGEKHRIATLPFSQT